MAMDAARAPHTSVGEPALWPRCSQQTCGQRRCNGLLSRTFPGPRPVPPASLNAAAATGRSFTLLLRTGAPRTRRLRRVDARAQPFSARSRPRPHRAVAVHRRPRETAGRGRTPRRSDDCSAVPSWACPGERVPCAAPTPLRRRLNGGAEAFCCGFTRRPCGPASSRWAVMSSQPGLTKVRPRLRDRGRDASRHVRCEHAPRTRKPAPRARANIYRQQAADFVLGSLCWRARDRQSTGPRGGVQFHVRTCAVCACASLHAVTIPTRPAVRIISVLCQSALQRGLCASGALA